MVLQEWVLRFVYAVERPMLWDTANRGRMPCSMLGHPLVYSIPYTAGLLVNVSTEMRLASHVRLLIYSEPEHVATLQPQDSRLL